MAKIINSSHKGERKKLFSRSFLINPPGFKRFWGDWESIIEGIDAKKISFIDKRGRKINADTSDPKSPYYGRSMYEIIKAYNMKTPIQGKIFTKCYSSKTQKFSGYEVLIGTVIAFMPYSKTAKQLQNPDVIVFGDSENTERQIIMVKVEEINTEKFDIIVTSQF